MYIKPSGGHRVSVPQNYSGNLFSATEPEREEEKEKIEELSADAPLPPLAPRSDIFSSFIGNEELIILGLILLLSLDGFGDDIIPILLLILLFKK